MPGLKVSVYGSLIALGVAGLAVWILWPTIQAALVASVKDEAKAQNLIASVLESYGIRVGS